MNFITKPLSNTNVYSDKLQIVKSKKKVKRQIFLQLYIFRENGPNIKLNKILCNWNTQHLTDSIGLNQNT